MSSSSSNSSTCYRGMKKFRTYLERGMEYDCGLEALCWEAWKDSPADPGRRLFGCSHYKIPGLNFNFFKWAYPPYTERAREVIEEMKMKLRHKDDEVSIVRDDLKFCHNKMVELKQQIVNTGIKLTYKMFEKEEEWNATKKNPVLLWLVGWFVWCRWCIFSAGKICVDDGIACFYWYQILKQCSAQNLYMYPTF